MIYGRSSTDTPPPPPHPPLSSAFVPWKKWDPDPDVQVTQPRSSAPLMAERPPKWWSKPTLLRYLACSHSPEHLPAGPGSSGYAAPPPVRQSQASRRRDKGKSVKESLSSSRLCQMVQSEGHATMRPAETGVVLQDKDRGFLLSRRLIGIHSPQSHKNVLT